MENPDRKLSYVHGIYKIDFTRKQMYLFLLSVVEDNSGYRFYFPLIFIPKAFL